MHLFMWCARRATGLSVVGLLLLCYWVITRELPCGGHGPNLEHFGEKGTTISRSSTSYTETWTLAFAYYCLLIHFLVCIFPLRACWAVRDITLHLKQSAQGEEFRSPGPVSGRRRIVSSSSRYIKTLGVNKRDPLCMGEANSDGTDIAEVSVIHAIVIPNYMEEIDTIKETLAVLAFHPQAYCSYDVFLAMEQREVNSETKALSLIQMFATRFRSIDYTVHPADIPGEAAGKGSNIGWAARYLSAKYSTETRKSVIVTGIDADSHLLPSYFTKITKMHLSHSATANTTLYSVPIIFDRNAHNVPAIVRVADILWSAAGISGLHRSSATAPPTSVYSLPLELIDRVGGWDGDAEAIGEDLHMYLKCFFALNGNLTCRTVLSPVSQSNVTGGGKGGIRGTIIDMRARYNQALRHMWGALDVGFALRQAVKMWRERQHTTRAFYPLHKNVAVNPNCCFPNGRLHNGNTQLPDETGNFSDITHATVKGPHWENLIYLFHRLFEAHFLPVHMTILVLTLALYDWVSADMQYSNGLRRIFSLCSVLRMLGFLEVGYYIFLYEGFHRLCVMTRKRAMTYAGLADEMYFSQRSIRKNLVDYALVPLVAPLYGAIPCAQAATTHFWTVDLVYSVSKKASRQQQKPALPGSMA